MKQEVDLDPCALEDAARRGHRRHPLFGSPDCGPVAASGFRCLQIRWRQGRGCKTSSNTVALALNLVPFAGIAFLWFIGVLRDRLGELEDRFFATVFLGSGLLFLAMLFASAAVAGGIIIAYAAKPDRAARLGDIRLRPRRHLRDHEHLRGQDGGGVHDLDVHARDPHRIHRALDRVARLCVRAASPG